MGYTLGLHTDIDLPFLLIDEIGRLDITSKIEHTHTHIHTCVCILHLSHLCNVMEEGHSRLVGFGIFQL